MSDAQINKQEQGLKKYFYRTSAVNFQKIPGNPVAYFASKRVGDLFHGNSSVGSRAKPRQGMATTNDAKFLRFWHEVNTSSININAKSNNEAKQSNKKWFPFLKGGEFRKWYGNNEYLVNFHNDGQEVCEYIDNTPGAKVKSNGRVINREFYFKKAITWSLISSESCAFRSCDEGFVLGHKGPAIYCDVEDFSSICAYLNSKVAHFLLKTIAPTIGFEVGQIARLPYLSRSIDVSALVKLARADWNSTEKSWGFIQLPLLHDLQREPKLEATYKKLHGHWRELTIEMQRLEEENNRIFIDAYGLQDELTPEVPLNEITLTCNPHYRYGGDKTEAELDALLLADTMREFISYAVGCMFGRYALDKPGLVLANQGETMEDYRRLVPNSRFEADADNVIPLLDGEWFADDVTERFRQLLRVTFGDEHYEENLAFIEQALNPKGKRNYTLRDYMLGEFYSDHVKRYKKRPIYWLFSSPMGTFNALIYLHRYRPDTASVVLRYLRDFRAKLAARQSTLEQVLINPATSQGEKTKAVKEIDSLKKQIIELQDYENDTLYPLATANVVLDLDDGVKVNYLKLGAALKKITGLDAKEED
jgi:type II restriction/modification system DNA methylase subunit YeeA